MKKSIIGATCACLVAVSINANAATVQWDVVSGGNGHLYEAVLVGADITWDEARAAVEARGSGWHLATITSAEENAFVESLFSSNPAFFNCCLFPSPLGRIASGPWLGGSSSTNASNDWTWITGEAFTFSDWGPTAPASNGNHISYAEFGASRVVAWNDLPGVYPALSSQSYIAEFSAVPIPATIWLFGSGLLGLIGVARRKTHV